MNERRFLVAGATLAAVGVATLALSIARADDKDASVEVDAKEMPASTMPEPAPTAVPETVPPPNTAPPETLPPTTAPYSVDLTLRVSSDGAVEAVVGTPSAACVDDEQASFVFGSASASVSCANGSFSLELTNIKPPLDPGPLPISLQVRGESFGPVEVDVPCAATFALVVPFAPPPYWIDEVCEGDAVPIVDGRSVAIATISETPDALCEFLPDGDDRYAVVNLADPSEPEECS